MKNKTYSGSIIFCLIMTFLFYCEKGFSQTHITPRVGMELITIKENYSYVRAISGFSYQNDYTDVPVASLAVGMDVEREIIDRFNLLYGVSYIRYNTGKRYYDHTYSFNSYHIISFDNINQKIGLSYYLTKNLGFGFAIDIDYVTNFKKENGNRAYMNRQLTYNSLLFLGANLNVRYIWRNFVIKVDYKRGVFDVNNGNKRFVEGNGISNPLYPQKGFGFYLGYRFSF